MVRVADDGVPVLQDEKTFSIVVVSKPLLRGVTAAGST